MMPEPGRIDSGPSRSERSERLREAIARQPVELLRSIRRAVRASDRGAPADKVADRVAEVFNEAVAVALAKAEEYDVERSPCAWVAGIASQIVRGLRRDAARERGRLARQADLGERWEDLLQVADRHDGAIEDRIDVREAMGRMDPASRLVLESRFDRGLDGSELADAIGAPNPGAARVRLARAKKKFLEAYSPPGSEARP